MKRNPKCPYCGRELRPAPAWFDGEKTFVGYYSCDCVKIERAVIELPSDIEYRNDQ